VIDIFDPSSPVQVAFLPAKQGTRPSDLKVEHVETPSFAGDLLVLSTEPCGAPNERRDDSSRMSVSADQRSLALWDVTDPTNPSILAQDFAPFSVSNSFVWREGHEAYMMLVNGDNGQDIHILDISDPRSPTEVTVTGRSQWLNPDASDSDQASAFANSAWVQKNDALATAYLAYGEAGLVLLDVTDAADPVFLGGSLDRGPDFSGESPDGSCEIARPSEDGRIAVSGDRQDASMKVVDVSDPSRMVELGRFTLEAAPRSDSSPAEGIGSSGFVRDGRAYWSWTRRGIRVIDFSACIAGGGSDSCSPTEIAHFSDGGDRVEAQSGVSQPWSVYVHDHPNGDTFILGSDRTSGLWILAAP
jgi:hypothetical protein